MDEQHPIRIGCCGWSYRDWLGKLYPEKCGAKEYLGYYAQRYDVVEVDSTFYGIPTPKTVATWHDRTPEGFRFSLKMPQVITHENALQQCESETEEFLTAIEQLRSKLECVCLQFGYFSPKVFLDVDDFTRVLTRFLSHWNPDIPLALEIRNREWLGETLLQCLRQYRVSLVLSLLSYMPEPWDLLERMDVATGPLAYLRLLGDRKGIEKITTEWDTTVIDKTEELTRTAEMIRKLARRAPVLTFVNNHYAGHAPDSVDYLLSQLYPERPKTSPASGTVELTQGSLF